MPRHSSGQPAGGRLRPRRRRTVLALTPCSPLYGSEEPWVPASRPVHGADEIEANILAGRERVRKARAEREAT